MYTKQANIKRTCLDILAMLIGLVLLGVFLTQTQTAMSVRRQHSNSQTKLAIARQRLESNDEEAAANLQTYDAFNQAKADSIRWFLDASETDATLDELMAQYQLAGLAVTDASGAVAQSVGVAPESFTVKALADGGSATQGGLRWYASAMANGDRLIAAMDFSAESAKLAELRSLRYALSTIKVGTTGYIIAFRGGKLAYHPDAALLGTDAQAAGFGDSELKSGFAGWAAPDGSRAYCEVVRAGDYLLASVVPEAELASINRRQVALSLVIFGVVVGLLVAYCVILRRDLRLRDDPTPHEYARLGKLYFNRTLAKKVFPVAAVALLAVFALTFYAQTLSALSRQSDISEAKLASVKELLDDNDARIAALRDEYSAEYSRRAQNVAWLLQKDPTLITDERLGELAENAQVRAIYVMDKRGRTVATNTVYKDFVLSDDPESQSYAFWDVVKGYKDVLAQDAREDDSAEKAMMQYVGVKRLDSEGMVQLGMLPKRLKNRLAATELSYVLSNIAVENDGFLFATDEAHRFLSYPNAKYIGRAAEDYGLTAAAFRDEAEGLQTVDATLCFVSCGEYGDKLLFVAVPTESIYQSRLAISLLTTAGALVLLLLLSLALVLSARKEEPEQEQRPDDASPKKETKGTIELKANDGKTRKTVSASMRWAGGSIAWRDRTPEQKLTRMVYYAVCILSVGLVLLLGDRSGALAQSSVLAYIMDMKWERTVSVFSLTYIAIIVLRVWVVSLILRKLIMAITTRFGARSETVGRLLDSFLKYIMIIGALFYGLNYIGIDSSTLLTSAGLLTLIVGLGSKSLISDILAGVFIVVEGEFRVGDIVTIGDWRGTVLEIGVRTTKIQDGGGNIKIFGNSNISGVVNMTKQYSYAFCDVGIEYGESLERVESVFKKELPLFKERIKAIEGGPFYKGVVELADSAVVLRIVAQCKESDRVQLTRDMNRELKLVFDKNNIGIPFPQVVVNQPTEFEKATRAEVRAAEKFVTEQKELSKDIHVKEE